jgi:hypothetical protein
MKLSKKGLVKRQDVLDAVRESLRTRYNQVVVFCSPLSKVQERVKVTVTREGVSNKKKKGKKAKKIRRKVRASWIPDEYRIIIGAPNYRERLWLKTCKKANTRPRRFFYPGKTGRVRLAK